MITVPLFHNIRQEEEVYITLFVTPKTLIRNQPFTYPRGCTRDG